MRRTVEIVPTREILDRACDRKAPLPDRLVRFDKVLDRLRTPAPRGLSDSDIEETWQLTESEKERLAELQAELLLDLESAGPTVAGRIKYTADPEDRIIRRSLP